METVVAHFCGAACVRDNYDVTLFLSLGLEDMAWLQLPELERARIVTGRAPGIKAHVERLLFFARSRDDAVIVLGPAMVLLASLVRVVCRKKYKIIDWPQFSLVVRYYRRRRFFRLADYHWAISTGVARELSDFGVEESKVFTIFNPVARCDQTIPPSSDGMTRFVYVGRLADDQKDLRGLLRAMAALPEGMEWRLDLFGGGPDEAALKACAADLHLGSRLTWHGWVSDPWSGVKTADALVLNSRYEGFALVLAEAIARGLPAISTDCPVGPADIVRPGLNGYLVAVGDAAALSSALESVQGDTFADRRQIKESIADLYNEAYDRRLATALADAFGD
jgi:UDP-D-galactose:(glucosyl)LPS alpha-1,6-D-galactosyltransferase